MEDFGVVRGDARIAPGKSGCAYIDRSNLGGIIARSIQSLEYNFPLLQVYQYIVMPDHVHILLRVKERSEKHLDFYIDSLVNFIETGYSKLIEREVQKFEIFLPGYCDKPLLRKRSLDGLFTYIRENPHRLAVRKQYPQFFQRTRSLMIGDTEYEAYGNLFLFRNPDKQAVKISRKFTPEEKQQKKESWLFEASKGTILVSPFISKEEKSIRVEAEKHGANIILITHEAFPERYKPAAHDFELCTQGRLLIISLGLPPNTTLTREHCLRMNALAEMIAASY